MRLTKTHISYMSPKTQCAEIVCKLLGHASNLSHILSEKKNTTIFSSHASTSVLFNLLFPSSFLNLHSTRRDKGKMGTNIVKASMVTVRHLKKHNWYSRQVENGFLQSVSSGLSVLFNFFSPFSHSSFHQFESRGGAEEVCLKGNPLCFVAEVTDSGWLTE